MFDSGDVFECIIGKDFFNNFNFDNDENFFDICSDDKGVEFEVIIIGVLDDKIYVFIGLECIGGIMVYDVSEFIEFSFV